MICAESNVHSNMGISVTLSDGSFGDQMFSEQTSPKRAGFFNNLLKRSSPKPNRVDKSIKSESSWSFFSKKAPASPVMSVTGGETLKDEDLARAMFIAELENEGRSEAEINLHMSHIIENRAAPVPPVAAPVAPVAAPVAPSPAKQKNIFSRFFSELQVAFEEIGFSDEEYIYPVYEQDLRGLTIGISSAPFYGALPPDTDMSYEELAALEPVYVGSRCINNLPQCTHDGTPLPGEQTKCAICLGEFEEGECLKSLPCVHYYHKDCIDSWLMVGHACPVCKRLVE